MKPGILEPTGVKTGDIFIQICCLRGYVDKTCQESREIKAGTVFLTLELWAVHKRGLSFRVIGYGGQL